MLWSVLYVNIGQWPTHCRHGQGAGLYGKPHAFSACFNFLLLQWCSILAVDAYCRAASLRVESNTVTGTPVLYLPESDVGCINPHFFRFIVYSGCYCCKSSSLWCSRHHISILRIGIHTAILIGWLRIDSFPCCFHKFLIMHWSTSCFSGTPESKWPQECSSREHVVFDLSF